MIDRARITEIASATRTPHHDLTFGTVLASLGGREIFNRFFFASALLHTIGLAQKPDERMSAMIARESIERAAPAAVAIFEQYGAEFNHDRE